MKCFIRMHVTCVCVCVFFPLSPVSSIVYVHIIAFMLSKLSITVGN